MAACGWTNRELSQTASARLRLHLHLHAASTTATRVEFVTCWIAITNARTWVPSAERPNAEASRALSIKYHLQRRTCVSTETKKSGPRLLSFSIVPPLTMTIHHALLHPAKDLKGVANFSNIGKNRPNLFGEIYKQNMCVEG